MNDSRTKCDRIADAISAKDLLLLEHLVADEPNIDRLRIEGETYHYSYSYTPLMVAVGQNWAEGVRFSIAKGSELNAFDEDGQTALHKAVACDLDEMVRILLAAGTDPDILTANTHATPLIQAVKLGRTKVVRTLIEDGANIEYCWDFEDRTPLMLAIGNLRLEIAQILIEAGADVNAKSKKGKTALEIARFLRNPEPIIQFLQDAGAIGDASLPDWDNMPF